MKKILVVAERRLAENAELRQRFERYAEDIWRAYGAGVKLISLESDSPRYLKGLIRREMSAGGPGMNAVALEALLPDRRVAHAERRLSTGEAGGALHWGAVFFKAEPPAWKKAEIALRKAGSDFMHHVSTQAAFVSTGHSGERKV